jgi:hypothetical protein
MATASRSMPRAAVGPASYGARQRAGSLWVASWGLRHHVMVCVLQHVAVEHVEAGVANKPHDDPRRFEASESRGLLPAPTVGLVRGMSSPESGPMQCMS